jgi:hypothetical protein
MKHLILGIFAVSNLALASGWLCQTGENVALDFRVRLYNDSHAPRRPYVFIVSERNLGTVLRAKEEEIDKAIMGRDTIYTARAKENEKLSTQLGWEVAEFTIPYREGVDKPLKGGAILPGELALELGAETTTLPLQCARHLKSK